MALLGFRRSTLVDAAVNLVPFLVLAAFIALLIVVDPWPPDLRAAVVSIGLLVVPLVVLALATGVVARLLQADEAAGSS